MMRKLVLAAVMLITASQISMAWKPRISYGMEWGYSATFLKTAQHNFICEEGYRIVDNPESNRYLSNGTIMFNAGTDLGNHFNVSACTGILGVYAKRWVIPMELRVKYLPAGVQCNGFLLQAAGGAEFPTSVLHETGLRGLLGCGYRLAVYKSISVDVLLSATVTLDHERILDPDTAEYVSRAKITANTAEYYAVNLSLAINF